MTPTYEVEIKDKGRVVLPAGLRSTCGFETGARVVVRQVGRGQALIETQEAILARIWANGTGRTDGVEALRNWRAEEATAEPRHGASEDPDAAGAATLAALGLD